MKAKSQRADKAAKDGLNDLIKLLPDNIVGIELGSYAGESAEIFCQSGKFKELHCFDIWNGDYHVGTGEAEFDFIKKKYPEIVKYKEYSNKIVEIFKNKHIDFIYIDAMHTYEAVKEDIKNSLIVLNNKGIIAGHDYIDTPRNPFGGVIKAVNENFKPDYLFQDTSWIKILQE